MALVVESVFKRFGPVQAVSDVSFTVEAGRVCGLLGSNGAGKTTTMRMIMRIYLPDLGRITWQGTPITNEVRMRFGYLPEERGLYPKMEVREQLIYLTELKGLSRPKAKERVDLWIDRLVLGQYVRRRVEQLSKGNQQKVQFAAAVASEPALCILDEPFSGLDPVNTIVMEDAFRAVAGEGTTILFSSHNMNQVENLCHDVVLMTRSQVVLQGDLRMIKRNTRRRSIYLRLESDDYSFLAQFPDAHVQGGPSGGKQITIADSISPNQLLQAAMTGGSVLEYSVGEPTLREIYLEKVGGSDA